ncbi:MAG: hypothetical protein PUH90_01210 [Clostridia bacterium]|nr:hypothetical protein [Clostridia bacterium]MDY2714602.1 hypothetical protein [Christensenellaceae bacterium]
MKKIYLFISSRITNVSKAIGFFTHSPSTHTTLSLNACFDEMYTFSRKTMRLFPSGFVKENIRTNVLKKRDTCPCSVYEIELTDEKYENLKRKIEKFEEEGEKYKYAVLGIFLCFFRIKKTFKYKRFCSQFVSELLRDGAGIELPYDPSLMRPKDFLKLDCLNLVYEGTIRGLAEKTDGLKTPFLTTAVKA